MSEIQRIEYALHSVSEYIREKYRTRDTLEIATKANTTDFLTEVDITVQKVLINYLRSQYPDDVMIAEESGLDSIGTSIPQRCWMVDPIDGTQNFLRGLLPEFGVSIGFLQDGEPVAGGVIFPITGDVFLAQRGSGAFRNKVRMSVSALDDPSKARIDIDFGSLDKRSQHIGKVDALLQCVGQVRSYGCSVMGFCQVADGQQDAYIPFSVKPWDVAAGMLLVKEAGGRVTSFDGAPVSPFTAERIGVASNNVIHDACLQCLNS
ncbi:MAG: inositol monophosphatase family protein [Sphaerochaeta sp.]|jgi:myo-inositol-1(or 4)-monophosphatase|nr:inositol monophosphatase family protein [Sphaerochaeta sp.]